jgi:hypothetical protein
MCFPLDGEEGALMYLVIVDLEHAEQKMLRFFEDYAAAKRFRREWGAWPAVICYVNHLIHDDGLSKSLGWGEA